MTSGPGLASEYCHSYTYTISYLIKEEGRPCSLRHLCYEEFDSSMSANVQAWQLFASHCQYISDPMLLSRGRYGLAFEAEDICYTVNVDDKECFSGTKEDLDGNRVEVYVIRHEIFAPRSYHQVING
jgi:hypothetical protein